MILFTQIIHKKQTQKIKNIFNFAVQYLEKHSSTVQQLALLSSTSYITAAFMLASGHPGLEITILYYCTLHSTVKVKYTKAQPLVEDARTSQCTPGTWRLDMRTHVCTLEGSHLEGSYVGDLFRHPDKQLYWLFIACFGPTFWPHLGCFHQIQLDCILLIFFGSG